MNVGLLEPKTVGKSKDTTIRVSAESAEVLRRVAALRGLSIGEYIDAALIPVAKKDLISEAQKIIPKPRRPRGGAGEG